MVIFNDTINIQFPKQGYRQKHTDFPERKANIRNVVKKKKLSSYEGLFFALIYLRHTWIAKLLSFLECAI